MLQWTSWTSSLQEMWLHQQEKLYVHWQRRARSLASLRISVRIMQVAATPEEIATGSHKEADMKELHEVLL